MNINYNRQQKINLFNWITKSIPQYVCKVPTVIHLCPMTGEEKRISLPVLAGNMQAIAECWELARFYGVSSVNYCPISGEIKVKSYPGGGHRHYRYGDRLVMYGNKIPSRNIGLPIVTCDLETLICQYMDVVKHASRKVAHSYGEMIGLGGISTEDAPLMAEIQDKTLEDWENYRQILAAQGSTLANVTSSISDLERVLRPFQEAISTESGVPSWLLFPDKVGNQFELEQRDVWAQGLFTSTVTPVLLGLLAKQGYNVLDIQTPVYRDAAYIADVENKKIDSEYKQSATKRNQSQSAATDASVVLNDKKFTHQVKMDVSQTNQISSPPQSEEPKFGNQQGRSL